MRSLAVGLLLGVLLFVAPVALLVLLLVYLLQPKAQPVQYVLPLCESPVDHETLIEEAANVERLR